MRAQTQATRDPETGLTLEERAFCEAYVRNGGNGAKAARASFSSLRNAVSDVASERGRIVLKRPHIQAFIAELQAGGDGKLAREAERVLEIERLMLAAFDERESDVFRLLALRSASRQMLELRERRRQRDGSAPWIKVQVSIESLPSPGPANKQLVKGDA